MPEFARRAVLADVQASIEHQPTADTGSEGDAQQIGCTLARTQSCFGKGEGSSVVDQMGWQASRVGQCLGEREVFPALSEIRWQDHQTASGVDHAGKAESEARDGLARILGGTGGTRDGGGEVGHDFIARAKGFRLKFSDVLELARSGQPAKCEAGSAEVNADGDSGDALTSSFRGRDRAR